MTRTIIISDVHGCIDELEDLITKIELRKDDQLIFNGDLVDKGPSSASVVAKVRELSSKHDVVLIKGNHEEKHARFRKHLARGEGQEKKMRGYDEMSTITSELSKEDILFLDTAVLYHHIPKHNAIAVHAGIPPTISKIPSHETLNKMTNKKRKHYDQMLRVRFVNPKGYMVMLGQEKPEDSYWADIYDGRYGTAFFGHQPFYGNEPKVYKHAVGIDLGCCFGNKLCAAVLSSEGTQYIMINARKQYAEKWKHITDKEKGWAKDNAAL